MASELQSQLKPKRPRFQDVPLAPEVIFPAQRQADVSEWAAPEVPRRQPGPAPDLGVGLVMIGMALAFIVYLSVFMALALHAWR
jgi:hypothetical protein